MKTIAGAILGAVVALIGLVWGPRPVCASGSWDPAARRYAGDGNPSFDPPGNDGRSSSSQPTLAKLADYEITEFPVSSGPVGITSGPDGNLWYTTGSKIGRITPYGAVTEFARPSGEFSADIATGPDGNLWFPESVANKIGRVTPTGSFTEFPLPAVNSNPNSIVAGPDGNLWFTEVGFFPGAGNKIGRITPTGTITEFPVPTANSGPNQIEIGPDGNLWFTETDGNKIGRITRDGTITEFLVPTANSGPVDIVAGRPDANLWFTETFGNKIGRINPTGTVVDEFPIPTAGIGVVGIAVGPDGNLWFTEAANNIGRISVTGSIIEIPIPTAASIPQGITTGPDGNIWFTEFGANQIGRIRFLCESAVAKPKLTIGRLTTPTGDDTLTFQGSMTFPSPFDPPLNLLTDGVRLRIGGSNGTVFDLTIPGGVFDKAVGVGWTVNASGKWTYKDKTAAPTGGIFTVVIQNKSATTAGLATFTIKGKKGAYPVKPSDLPLTGRITLLGHCADATFPGPAPAPHCSFNGAGSTVKCK